MDPQLLRGGFRIGFLILAVALITLPFQPRGSAELVVTVMAAIVGGAFVIGIALVARLGSPPLPHDKTDRKRYYIPAQPGGAGRSDVAGKGRPPTTGAP